MNFCYLLSGDYRIDMPDPPFLCLAGQQISAIRRKTSKRKLAAKEAHCGQTFAGVLIPAAQCHAPAAIFFNILECGNEIIHPAQRVRQSSLIRQPLYSTWNLEVGGPLLRLALPSGNQAPGCGIDTCETGSHTRRFAGWRAAHRALNGSPLHDDFTAVDAGAHVEGTGTDLTGER